MSNPAEVLSTTKSELEVRANLRGVQQNGIPAKLMLSAQKLALSSPGNGLVVDPALRGGALLQATSRSYKESEKR